MNDYEITYILRPTLEEADVDARAVTFSEIVSNGGGEVGVIEKLGKKRLAYEIADVREGSYVVMGFKSDAATSKELERLMKLHEDVLRHIVVRLDKKALAAAAAGPPPVLPAYEGHR
jgi:small subunit ribosomal protein S6